MPSVLVTPATGRRRDSIWRVEEKGHTHTHHHKDPHTNTRKHTHIPPQIHTHTHTPTHINTHTFDVLDIRCCPANVRSSAADY